MPQWTRSEGITPSTVEWRREPVGPALLARTFNVASLLHGRSGNNKDHGEYRCERTGTSSCRTAPIVDEGFPAEVLGIGGPQNA